jgi:hypothetical protein
MFLRTLPRLSKTPKTSWSNPLLCPAAPPTWQLLQRHVVHDLVVPALQEGAVDGAERHEALARQAGRKGDGVLLRNAHVVGALREVLLKAVQA